MFNFKNLITKINKNKWLIFSLQKIKFFFVSIVFIIIIINKIKINKIKVCLCTLAKFENKYIKEFVQHYKKYGVDKIFLYDNNDINGENFEEILYDYIKKGFVKVINWRGKYQSMMKIMNDCYHKNYANFDWLIFYEIDEFIHLYNYSNIKPFLSQNNFKYCQVIHLNLVCHTDNDLLFYENKSLFERFPKIVNNFKPNSIKLERKSIIRGHIDGVLINHNHLGDTRLKSCNSFGLQEKYKCFYSYNGDQKYYYIDHFYSKSTEEFIEKITKGDAFRNDPHYIYERIDKYFAQNKITKIKLDLIEKKANVNLSKYRKKLKF